MLNEPSTNDEDPNTTLQLDLAGRELPSYITVEGPIGSGKTTLVKKLAQSFHYDTLLEKAEENPFLERFYQDPRSAALPTQLHFLFQRAKQIQGLRQGDMFEPVRIADFLIEKDPLFAEVVLDDDEFKLYQQVYAQLTINAPQPDLVIYLQAPIDVLKTRIRQRGITMEQNIEPNYLEKLHEAYNRFFLYYTQSPLLIINAAHIDWVNNPIDYSKLVEQILSIKSGRHYYNPSSDF